MTFPVFALAVIVLNLQQVGGGNYGTQVNFVDPSISLFDPEKATFSGATQTTYAQVMADAETAILTLASALGYTITAADIQWGSVQATLRSFATPTRSLNSAFQVSTSHDADVTYSVEIASTLSVATGQSGTVTLEYADDSSFTINVKTVQSSINGNTGALAIGLNLTQTGTATLTGKIPAGKYVRLRTTNNTGSPTFTYKSALEILL